MAAHFCIAIHYWCSLPTGISFPTIKAVSGVLTDEITFEYQTERWGKPATIRLSRINDNLIEAQLCDANGIRCLDNSDWMEFSIIGDGELLENQGTTTGSRRIQAANGRATIRVKSQTGDYIVGVRCGKIKAVEGTR